MGPIDIASMLKQLGEISQRQDVQKKRRDREKLFANNNLQGKDTDTDVQQVDFVQNEIKPEGHQTSPVASLKKMAKEEEEEHESSVEKINEDYKANFLDISE